MPSASDAVKGTVHPVLHPAPLSAAEIPIYHHVASGRKHNCQLRPDSPPDQAQAVVARQKASKDCRPTAHRHPGQAAAPFTGMQHHAVRRTGVLQLDAEIAAGICRPQAQRTVLLCFLLQAKASPAGQYSVYCSSLALTRYSPAPTPPNRYLPAVLVLVTETSCSRVTPPSVTTR